jgi:hypothetical protein
MSPDVFNIGYLYQNLRSAIRIVASADAVDGMFRKSETTGDPLGKNCVLILFRLH